MATKKAGGSTENNRDSRSKRRGVKRHDGQLVQAGEVLIRQKGFWYRPGDNTYVGKDWTIHAGVTGKVSFSQRRVMKFDGSRDHATVIAVKPVSA